MPPMIETIDTLHSQRAPGIPVEQPVPATEAAAVPGMVLAPELPVLHPQGVKE